MFGRVGRSTLRSIDHRVATMLKSTRINLNSMKKTILSILFITTIMTLTSACDSQKVDNVADTSVSETTSEQVTATLKTSQGDIKIKLYTKEAPETAKNFIELAKQDKYDNAIFHRVIDNFMIQGGDFENRNGTGGYSYKGPGTSLEDEFGKGLSHIRGAVSMANAGPDTGGSQFFIVQATKGTPFLDGKHAIFGIVTEGMDAVDKIAKLETDGMDKPLKEVIIEDVIIDGE